MAELVTSPPASAGIAPPAPSVLAPLRDPLGGPLPRRLSAFVAQPPVKKALPWFAGVAGAGVLALTWAAMAPAPQRVLYASLDDADRASVVAALDTGGIGYTIDNSTGALTVAEDDLYRARMLVAQDGALATPESGTQMLDSLPMGASRTLEGDRLRAARERELTLTIAEIDGVESVRVHLAEADRSVFVRENIPPSASVMVRMARGRQLSASQVTAIANVVAASVPGLSIDAVRIADQHGRLLSQPDADNPDRLDLQSRMEAKLRGQVEQLLAPIVGAGNFSSEIQVRLNMDETTSARESYDREGALRRETQQQSQGGGPAMGVPGVLSNTPPPDAQAVNEAPAGNTPQAPQVEESSSTRQYELGREVAVSNSTPGTLERLSVAVALNREAMAGMKPADTQALERLIGAAVGADVQRGDTVAVIVRPFTTPLEEAVGFWEQPWFATVVRNVVALIAVLLVLLLAVRPLVRSVTGEKAKAAKGKGKLVKATSEEGDEDAEDAPADGAAALGAPDALPQLPDLMPADDPRRLAAQMELARQIVRDKPDDALLALRRMINQPRAEAA
ncbi:flagellar basal-body MS-ring/collar protein FliF [Croceibacterium ferulae]|uniref:flagellar basal-body MS-ring/collar protein FliF n=1 Tax=Croceibacterium ferulae TaxID=1854641 RepID=UPI000EAFF441|nr:flagellar basal-body MS-ring/collar protein FliF [Croceibacterium ferulae]